MTDPLANKRCIGLVRCSTNAQIEMSIPQQTELLKFFAEKHGLLWVGSEEVEGVPGSWAGNRDDIERLKQRKSTANDYEIILVQDRSRWTRGGQDHGSQLRADFGKLGVRVVSTDRPVVPEEYEWIIEGLQDQASE